MSDPYEVLGLADDADEAEIRRRYLELVRQSPPDREPERFAAVRAAYDEVRDPVRRLEAQLFRVDDERLARRARGGPPRPASRRRGSRWTTLLSLAEHAMTDRPTTKRSWPASGSGSRRPAPRPRRRRTSPRRRRTITAVGLYRLVEEFTALRHELKLQTEEDARPPGAGRGAAAGAAGRRSSSSAPSSRRRPRRPGRRASPWPRPWPTSTRRSTAAAPRSRRPAGGMVDEAAAEAPPSGPRRAATPGQSWFRRRLDRTYHEAVREVVRQHGPEAARPLFDALLEGYGLIQARLRRAMDAEQIRRIEAVGRPVDPGRMTVIEVVDDPNRPPSEVVEEVRTGLHLAGPGAPVRRGPAARAVHDLDERRAIARPRERKSSFGSLTDRGNHRRDRPGDDQQRGGDRPRRPAGRPAEEDGDPILPSVVGLDPQGRLLVGQAARNQWVLAPERTVTSIKRKMGQDVDRHARRPGVHAPGNLGDDPPDAQGSAPRRRWATPVKKAVITVPAFFNEGQRQATREAGELAGLEVVRIINEPTAAVLTYDPHPPEMERLLVYDLGGGTFDVSIVQVEGGVVEVLASHGDTHLGGDDFDELLLDYVCGPLPRRARHRPARRASLQEPPPARRRGGEEAALVRPVRPDRGGVHRREGRRPAAPEDWRSIAGSTRR